MTKTHENAKAIEGQKRRLMTFREFVEFRKKFGDDAVRRLVKRNQNV
jgi:hypothetical protein